MPGLLTIMGSGETSPTMVSIHRLIAGRLPAAASGVLIETPYGFQENVAEISAKACRYFAASVGLTAAAPGLRGDGSGDGDGGLAMVRTAQWLFSGPGSPTYAMRCWSDQPIAQALHDRIRQRRGVTVFASAAAATLGRWTVPVYEIYKAGEPARWADGLDLLAHLDLKVALIPHCDNTEGGTHDTRFCYLGERRLRVMEQALPDDAAVLGVDEHTAVFIARRDAAAMAQAILDLESTVHAWSSDTEQDDGAEQARAVLRTLIVRLGQTATSGVADPAEVLRPVVQPLVSLRERLRARRDYCAADEVRDALAAIGVDLRDTPDGVDWSLR